MYMFQQKNKMQTHVTSTIICCLCWCGCYQEIYAIIYFFSASSALSLDTMQYDQLQPDKVFLASAVCIVAGLWNVHEEKNYTGADASARTFTSHQHTRVTL